MISSIVLLLLQFFGAINTDKSLAFWKWYFTALIIEIVIYLIGLRKLDKWDLKTNYGRDRNVKV